MKQHPDSEPIYALATPLGRSAISVVRVSAAVLPPELLAALNLVSASRGCYHKTLDIGGLNESCLLLNFPAPASYNGEHIVEIHAHGNPAIFSELFVWLESFGLREAEPGEFTKRAFLNNKMSLSEAEGVALGIEAGSFESAVALNDFRSGRLAERVKGAIAESENLLVQLESQLDFSDEEDVSTLSKEAAFQSFGDLASKIGHLIENYAPFEKESERLKVVFTGKPNVGKSSLFNRVVGSEEAIVSSTPGTTRDVVRKTVQMAGVEVELQDTAGVRASGTNEIEKEGIEKGRKAVSDSDLVFLVIDRAEDIINKKGINTIFNKSDISDVPSSFSGFVVSAKTGDGVLSLCNFISEKAKPKSEKGLVSKRVYSSLVKSHSLLTSVSSGSDFYEHGAQQLRDCLLLLKDIYGSFDNEKILDEIFKNFCIGK